MYLEKNSIQNNQISRKQGKINLQKISIDSTSIVVKKGNVVEMRNSRRFYAQKYML